VNSAVQALAQRLRQRDHEPRDLLAPRPIVVASTASRIRKTVAFIGPGYLVAVGYMDPGNWATSLGGGSQYGYALLSVVVLASLMAVMLQAAAVRLGIGAGMDLAQACRRHCSPALNASLWIGCEIAIVACNLAEVLGMACGLNLLFHIPLPLAVCLTALDVMLVLRLQRRGVRYLETFIMGLVALIAVCLLIELAWLHPPAGAVMAGLAPPRAILTDSAMLYLAVGILGATIMPHNLYLHSALVQTRRHERSPPAVRAAIRYATADSTVALALAACVNVVILVLAAGVFHRPGQPAVSELGEAYRLLSPLLGVNAASSLFGIGLIASGLSASITGTLAGQVVMEGFLQVPLSAPRRALLTRSLALLPAVAVAALLGAGGVTKLMVLSQVILGLQLPFAMVPLLWFTTRRAVLGEYAFRPVASTLLWMVAIAMIAVNIWALRQCI
jgi:manganese transport protein